MKRIGEIIQNSFLSSILLSFARKNSEAKASKAEKTTKKELDKLWDLARKVEESNFSEGDMKEEIAASFRKIRKKYKTLTKLYLLLISLFSVHQLFLL